MSFFPWLFSRFLLLPFFASVFCTSLFVIQYLHNARRRYFLFQTFLSKYEDFLAVVILISSYSVNHKFIFMLCDHFFLLVLYILCKYTHTYTHMCNRCSAIYYIFQIKKRELFFSQVLFVFT